MTTQRLCPCEQRDAVASSMHKHNGETEVTEDNDDRSGGGYPRPASNMCSGKRDGGRDKQHCAIGDYTGGARRMDCAGHGQGW